MNGSETNGLQNYDDLYADVLLWVNNGWVDYCVPQLYWQIGHPAADYATLIRWWDKHAANRPLFIGEDVERTVKYPSLTNPNSNQMPDKHVADNYGNYGNVLRNAYWRYPALPPSMPFLDNKSPKKPRKMKPVWTSDGYILFWSAPQAKKWGDKTNRYVVYRFGKDEKVNLEEASHIIAITGDTMYRLPYNHGKEKFTYVVTALDRVGNESKGKKVKIKL